MFHKVLNLYSGVGGNRKLWPKDVSVTAVERREDVADAYSKLYPLDNIVIGDAHKFLEKNYMNYDFIWSSPPCQTHSGMRHNLGVGAKGFDPLMPDMSLYAEVIFLKHNALPQQRWVIENVNPYYVPLIDAPLLQRHRYWANFEIPLVKFPTDKLRSAQIPDLQRHHGINLSDFKIKGKRQVLRNCVHPDMGKHVFNAALSSYRQPHPIGD